MNACCPYCGAEYLLAEARCWDCKLALDDPPQPTLALDDPSDEAGYELDDWPAPARSKLTASLGDLGIPTRWEPGLTLVVREADADAVDRLLDQLDEEDWPDDDVDDDAGELAHEAMGDLFVVADRLMHEPWDEGIGAELVEVAARVAESPHRSGSTLGRGTGSRSPPTPSPGISRLDPARRSWLPRPERCATC